MATKAFANFHERNVRVKERNILVQDNERENLKIVKFENDSIYAVEQNFL